MRRIKFVAEKYEVTQHTVLAWIQSGELAAIDVSRNRGGKPSWRVSDEALEAFEQLRRPCPAIPKASKKRKPQDETVIPFY